MRVRAQDLETLVRQRISPAIPGLYPNPLPTDREALRRAVQERLRAHARRVLGSRVDVYVEDRGDADRFIAVFTPLR